MGQILAPLSREKMIAVDHTLLSESALENLIIDIITRQSTDYGDFEVEIQSKKNQLMSKLKSGEAIIVFSPKEEACDIIKAEDFQAFSTME